jgi:hypothetical protein
MCSKGIEMISCACGKRWCNGDANTCPYNTPAYIGSNPALEEEIEDTIRRLYLGTYKQVGTSVITVNMPLGEIHDNW